MHGGPRYDALDFFAPAMVGYFAFFFVFLLTAVAFLRERVAGTLERLMAAPLRRSELVVGYMAGFGLFALLQAVAVILVAVLGLRVHYHGALLSVFVLVLALALVAVNLGIFLSTFARTELQAVQFIPIVILPQGLLCGVIWPLSSLPDWLRPAAYALPLTYGVGALRDVMLKGQGLLTTSVRLDLLAVLAFAALFAALAVGTIRRQGA